MEKAIPISSLDDFAKLANEVRGKLKKSRTSWEQRQIKTVASVYEILLRAPKEYLTKSQRIVFVQRGVVADIAIYLSGNRVSEEVARTYLRPRMVIRAWLGTNSDSGTLVTVVRVFSEDRKSY